MACPGQAYNLVPLPKPVRWTQAVGGVRYGPLMCSPAWRAPGHARHELPIPGRRPFVQVQQQLHHEMLKPVAVGVRHREPGGILPRQHRRGGCSRPDRRLHGFAELPPVP